MATIYGTSHYSYVAGRYHSIANADTLYGTSSGDYIDAGGNNDYVYTGAGNDAVHGGSGDDVLSTLGTSAHTGNDYVYGEAGNDTIIYSYSYDSQHLFGDSAGLSIADGNDTIYSGYGSDYIYGGGGHDTVFGGAGNDVIYGDLPGNLGTGNDTIDGGAGGDSIYGGAGDDRIQGGADGDWLSGGVGTDTFVFNNGDSRLTWETADTIMDFNRTYDWLDMPVVGTSANFVSGTFTSSHYTSHDVMNDAYHATFSMGQLGTQYAFVTDGHNGYLFANTNGTAGFDTGVELLGLTSVNDLRYYDII